MTGPDRGVRVDVPQTENEQAADGPERIQLSRKKGFRLGPSARSVARPSYFGNPYRVGDVYLVSSLLPFPVPTARTREGPAGTPDTDLAVVRCADRVTAVAWFREWAPLGIEPTKLELLRGLDLGCWCPLDAACHADVLLEIANRPSVQTGEQP